MKSSPVIRKKRRSRIDGQTAMGVEVLQTRVRLGGGSALYRCRATDAITCLRTNALSYRMASSVHPVWATSENGFFRIRAYLPASICIPTLFSRRTARRPAVTRKKEDRELTGRQPWELRSCELVFASVRFCTLSLPGYRRNNVLEKERVVPSRS